MSNFSIVTKQNLYYETIERVLTTNQTKPSGAAVQQATSSLISHLTALETGLSALVILLTGPLSDQFGRKPFLLSNLVLLTSTHLGLILQHVAGGGLSAHEDINIFYGISCLFGLSGGLYNFCLLVFSYIGDLSSRDPATRLRRFTLAEASGTSALIAGSVVFGLLASSRAGEVVAVFGTCAVLLSISILYVIVRVKNILPQQFGRKEQERGIVDQLAARFHSLATVAFKARPAKSTRVVILTIILCFLLQEMPYQGG
jgi:MFS family permease